MTANAKLNGTITATGGANSDERGFDYGYSSGSYSSSWTESGSFGTGNFSHKIVGLDYARKVYFRAKAHNSAGWGYGSEKSFVTPGPSVLRPWLKTRPVPYEALEVIAGYYDLKVHDVLRGELK